MTQTAVDRQFEQKDTPTPGFAEQSAAQLHRIVLQYMSAMEVEQIARALQLAFSGYHNAQGEWSIARLEYALAVATILAQNHIDAVGVAAGLIFEAVDAEFITLEGVESIAFVDQLFLFCL